jgi:hypothetical protein
MHMLANAAEMTIFLFLGVFTITTQMQVTLISHDNDNEEMCHMQGFGSGSVSGSALI